MQLPQKEKIMPQAEEQPSAAAPAQAPTNVPAQEVGSSRVQASATANISTESIKAAGDVLTPGQPLASPLGSQLGMPFGSQFSRPDTNVPLPDMPGSESSADDSTAVVAANPAQAGASGTGLPDLATMMADLAPETGGLQPLGMDITPAKKREKSNLEIFLRQLLLGGDHEQKPDKSMR